MIWIIAAIPIWILGCFFLCGALLAVPFRKPEETAAELTGQFIFGLIFSGVFFVIAAKIAS